MFVENLVGTVVFGRKPFVVNRSYKSQNLSRSFDFNKSTLKYLTKTAYEFSVTRTCKIGVMSIKLHMFRLLLLLFFFFFSWWFADIS